MKYFGLSLLFISLILSTCENAVKTDIETIDPRLIGKWYFYDEIPTPGGRNYEFSLNKWHLNIYQGWGATHGPSYYVQASNGNINLLSWDGDNEGLLSHYQFVEPGEFDYEILEAVKTNEKWRLYELYKLKAAAGSGNLCRFIFDGEASLSYLIEDMYGKTYLLARWDNVNLDIYIDE